MIDIRINGPFDDEIFPPEVTRWLENCTVFISAQRTERGTYLVNVEELLNAIGRSRGREIEAEATKLLIGIHGEEFLNDSVELHTAQCELLAN